MVEQISVVVEVRGCDDVCEGRSVWSVILSVSGVSIADCVPPLHTVQLLPLLHLGVVGADSDFPVYQDGSSSLHRVEATLFWIGEFVPDTL